MTSACRSRMLRGGASRPTPKLRQQPYLSIFPHVPLGNIVERETSRQKNSSPVALSWSTPPDCNDWRATSLALLGERERCVREIDIWLVERHNVMERAVYLRKSFSCWKERVLSDSVIFEKDVAIPMREGAVLRANVYRPNTSERFPVILTVGPYGKDLHFEDFDAGAYAQIDEHGPYLNWETPNPDWWVPRGYVVVRVDQRGIGASPGTINLFTRKQGEDFYDAIEWAAHEDWSTGKVGLLGISYYALTQWQVAALQTPHLAAIIPWEGMVDLYRDASRHGGMLSNVFLAAWYPRQVLSVQYGADGSVPEQERAANRIDPLPLMREHVLDDAFYQAFTPDVRQIQVPLLSVGNWGGFGLHLRGNIEGYLEPPRRTNGCESTWATTIPRSTARKDEPSRSAFSPTGSKDRTTACSQILPFNWPFVRAAGSRGGLNRSGRWHEPSGVASTWMPRPAAYRSSLHSSRRW